MSVFDFPASRGIKKVEKNELAKESRPPSPDLGGRRGVSSEKALVRRNCLTKEGMGGVQRLGA